jgi:5-formyltetrahydrofolate cyclo-ligase
MNKADLRKEFLRKRRELSVEMTSEFSSRIAEGFFRSFSLNAINTLHSFIALKEMNEPDTSLIYEKVWRDHPQILTVAPRINNTDTSIENAVFDSDSQLDLNKFGVPEPVGETVIEPAAIDLVIIPLLCFDEHGNRVGYGKGFYDRFLSQCRNDCQKVGLSFFAPVAMIEDVNEYDVILDAVVTPSEVFRWN